MQISPEATQLEMNTASTKGQVSGLFFNFLYIIENVELINYVVWLICQSRVHTGSSHWVRTTIK